MRVRLVMAVCAITIFLGLSALLFGNVFESNSTTAKPPAPATSASSGKAAASNPDLERQLREASFKLVRSHTKATQECSYDDRDSAGNCPVESIQEWRRSGATVTLTDHRRSGVYSIDTIGFDTPTTTPIGKFAQTWCTPSDVDRTNLAFVLDGSAAILGWVDQGSLQLSPNQAIADGYVAETSSGTCYVAALVRV